MITNRLNAADPTMVEGPSAPLWKSFLKISLMASKISGAEEPNAIKVRFATVSFHTFVVM